MGKYAFFSCANGFMAASPLADMAKIMQTVRQTGIYNATNKTNIKASWSMVDQSLSMPVVNVRDNLTLSASSNVLTFEPFSDAAISIKQLINLTSIVNP